MNNSSSQRLHVGIDKRLRLRDSPRETWVRSLLALCTGFICIQYIFLIFADTHVLKWSTVRIRQFSIHCSTWVVYHIFPHFSVGKFPATGCQFEPRKELMFRWCRVKWVLRKSVWRNGWGKWCEVYTTLMRRILGSTNTPPSFSYCLKHDFVTRSFDELKFHGGGRAHKK